MKINPHILFFGNSVDKSIQIDLLKEYMLHMDDSLSKSVQSCEGKHEDLSLSLKCIADDKSDLLSNHFPELLHGGFVISAVIFLENELTTFCKDLKRVENLGLTHKDLSGSFIERFKKYCEHIAKVDLSLSNEAWEDIKGVLDIRNCLVHNLGSIVNFGKANTIKAFSERHGLPKIVDDSIVIDKEVSIRILDIIDNFIEAFYQGALARYHK